MKTFNKELEFKNNVGSVLYTYYSSTYNIIMRLYTGEKRKKFCYVLRCKTLEEFENKLNYYIKYYGFMTLDEQQEYKIKMQNVELLYQKHLVFENEQSVKNEKLKAFNELILQQEKRKAKFKNQIELL